MKSGYSIGNARWLQTGTLGAWLKEAKHGTIGISNNHVLAQFNQAQRGDSIVQPGRFDQSDENEIGTFEGYKRIEWWTQTDSQVNYIDFAFFLPKSQSVVDFKFPDSSVPDGICYPRRNLRVEKFGRTTELTNGVILAIDATIAVEHNRRRAVFKEQVSIEMNIQSGDSGACLLTRQRKICGLIFAKDITGTLAYANNIKHIQRYGDMTFLF